MREELRQFVLRYPALKRAAPYFEPDFDWSGAKNFLLSIFFLSIAMALALHGAALIDRGLWRWGATLHSLALIIAFFVSVRLVPRMAINTPLRWLFYEINYKLTREGGVYITAIFIIALAALNTGNNLLYIILSCLLAGILVSGAVSRMVLTGIELSLELPEHIFAQRPVLATLTLNNRKLTLPSFSLLVSSPEAKNGKKKLAAPSRRVLDQPVYFPYIPRNKQSTQQVELLFPRRGRYAQDAFSVSSKFLSGFCSRRASSRPPAKWWSIRRCNRRRSSTRFCRSSAASGELLPRPRHDLYTIRDFQPGDPARHLDWKASAKAQALKVREFAREDERRVELIFDNFLPRESRGADAQARFERGVSFCACLAWHFNEIDSQMMFHSPPMQTRMTGAGEIIYDILHHLALVEPQADSDNLFLESLSGEVDTFKIIVTARSRGSIPTALWTSSYFVFMDRCSEKTPQPSTELLRWFEATSAICRGDTRDPYAIWIAEIMLQQTRADGNPYYPLLAPFPTQAGGAAARAATVGGAGLLLARGTCTMPQKIVREHNGRFPDTLAARWRCPASRLHRRAILSIAYETCRGSGRQRRPRAGAAFPPARPDPNNRAALQPLADKLVDRRRPGDFNQA
jgi:hypothetical protein